MKLNVKFFYKLIQKIILKYCNIHFEYNNVSLININKLQLNKM
jgi:hypothetical protein